MGLRENARTSDIFKNFLGMSIGYRLDRPQKSFWKKYVRRAISQQPMPRKSRLQTAHLGAPSASEMGAVVPA
jgi:hypothetical protein